MELLEVFDYDYKGFGNCKSKCRVYMKKVTNPRYGDTMFVCFEDLGIGTSVTNFSEELASQIVQKFDLDPKEVRFFEYYSHEGTEYEPTLDEIKYSWDGLTARYPQWSRPEFDLSHVFGLEKV